MSRQPHFCILPTTQLWSPGLSPGAAKIQAISSSCEVVLLIRSLAPKRETRGRQIC